ncbi:rhodanese domain protein (plasmid) [Legionella adelaidensis]|uniref:tRNA uridine(34) hydroxylase n=1 Tax=Legionella adelaidensis TaxID=45056 RepID=A0A0W0R4V5_9GAMM|nr:rhodanese-related sulfurtransferase [Legionella adelaidensis]KTC66102.1 sulfur transferase [Legionella adelaidensis]VEH85828.1 rhodanese domain protein [Legionella adelaidensis]
MKQYVIAAFYKFIPLDDYESLKNPLLAVMKENRILGTVLLAHEGINGSIAATPEDIIAFYNHLHADPRFSDLVFKETYDDMMPFEKAKVKFRKEIVTLGVPDVNPLKSCGIYVSPEEWNTLINDPDVVVVDTRNDYEVELGTFKNAIDPKTENFRDFPEYVKNNLMDKKDKKIAMFCTGGIRCEKSTSYLLNLGFKEVYHLQGGILNYLATIPEAQSLWEGRCFVFDERIAIEKV